MNGLSIPGSKLLTFKRPKNHEGRQESVAQFLRRARRTAGAGGEKVVSIDSLRPPPPTSLKAASK